MKAKRTCSRGHAFTGEEPCPTCWPEYRTYDMEADLWIYPGETANWHFLTLPKKESDAIRERFGGAARGWGSLKVAARIGKTTWSTSVFPDKKRGAYLLPVKSDVRKRENITTGDRVAFRVDVLE